MELQDDALYESSDFSRVEEADEFEPGEIVQNHSEPTRHTYVLRFDGGARGNPGIAGSGAIVWYSTQFDRSWTVIGTDAHYIDAMTTNNAAEYIGLIRGVGEILSPHMQTSMSTNAFSPNDEVFLRVEGDSKLILNQVQGLWHVKNENLRHYKDQVTNGLHQIRRLCHTKSLPLDISFNFIRREWNKDADRLANEGMDQTRTQQGVSGHDTEDGTVFFFFN
jgi:probable phosphoglycerate mutase